MSAAMTPERRAHLEQVVATARCAGELDGIRGQLTHTGEIDDALRAAIARRKVELQRERRGLTR